MPFYAIATLLSIAIGTALWFIGLGVFIGYTIGMAIGIMIPLAIVQKLGRKAKHSKFSTMLFHKLTKYRASIYNIRVQGPQEASARTVVYDNAHEYADLMDILRGQLKIPASKAKELAKHAFGTAKNEPFEKKIRVALQYWGNGQKEIEGTQ